MFQILKNPNFDLMGKRHIFLGLSVVLVLLSIGIISVNGIKRHVELSGGTELQLMFAEAPDIGQIRASVGNVSDATPVVTTLGDDGDNEVLIKVAATAKETEEYEARKEEARANAESGSRIVIPGKIEAIVGALNQDLFAGSIQADKLDLNVKDRASIASLLTPSLGAEGADQLAEQIVELRKQNRIFTSIDDLTGIPGWTPGAQEVLQRDAYFGPYAIRSQNYIGPAIGKETRNKAMMAIVGSLIGMLLYIAFRFQIRWGAAAVIALAHDTIIGLGLFSIAGFEASQAVVAAFLTLVGYSINDTVVVFDRIRENMQAKGTSLKFVDVVNKSLNQTLSRTIITSGSTWLVVLGLFLFGGQALKGFAFVLTAGVLVGTYSSIFVASPIVIWWHQQMVKRAAAGSGAAARPASSSAAS